MGCGAKCCGCLGFVLLVCGIGAVAAGCWTLNWVERGVGNLGLWRYCPLGIKSECDHWTHDISGIPDWWLISEGLVTGGLALMVIGLICSFFWMCKITSSCLGRTVSISIFIGALCIYAGLILFTVQFHNDDGALFYNNSAGDLGWSYYITWVGAVVASFASSMLSCATKMSSSV